MDDPDTPDDDEVDDEERLNRTAESAACSTLCPSFGMSPGQSQSIGAGSFTASFSGQQLDSQSTQRDEAQPSSTTSCGSGGAATEAPPLLPAGDLVPEAPQAFEAAPDGPNIPIATPGTVTVPATLDITESKTDRTDAPQPPPFDAASLLPDRRRRVRRPKHRPTERTAARGFIWKCPLCDRQKAMERDGLIRHL